MDIGLYICMYMRLDGYRVRQNLIGLSALYKFLHSEHVYVLRPDVVICTVCTQSN